MQADVIENARRAVALLNDMPAMPPVAKASALLTAAAVIIDQIAPSPGAKLDMLNELIAPTLHEWAAADHGTRAGRASASTQ